MQEEYRRIYNVLQPMDSIGAAVSGFAKLEVRHGRCRLAFSMQGLKAGDGEVYRAALISRDLRRAVDVGRMGADYRGCAACEAVYESGDVQRWPVSDYDAVAVYRMAPGQVQLVLVGHVGKGAPVDWKVVRALVARLHEPPAAPVGPAPIAPPAPPASAESGAAAEPSAAKTSDAPPSAPSAAAESDAASDMPAAPDPPPASDDAPVVVAASADEQTGEQLPGGQEPTEVGVPSSDEPMEPGAFRAVGPEDEAFYAPPPPPPASLRRAAAPAAQDERYTWPEAARDTAALFRGAEPVQAIDGLAVYRRVAMPGGIIGIDHYLLGVRLQESEVVAVAYAIPGSYRATPPPGLEGYLWQPAPSGGSGYWVCWQDAGTGVNIPPPA